MKNRNLIISILITLSAGASFGMESQNSASKRDLAAEISLARTEEQNLFKSFQSDFAESKQKASAEQTEVEEFLSSEIKWRTPKHNSKNN